MQSEHAAGASSSSLVQREECHHLAPADTSIPLQRCNSRSVQALVQEFECVKE